MIIPETTSDLFLWASDKDTHLVAGFEPTATGIEATYRDRQGLEIVVHFAHDNRVTFEVLKLIESAA